MSRFYGTLDGKGKTLSTREGTESTGLKATANGWSIGSETQMRSAGDCDVVEMKLTGGSNSDPHPTIEVSALKDANGIAVEVWTGKLTYVLDQQNGLLVLKL